MSTSLLVDLDNDDQTNMDDLKKQLRDATAPQDRETPKDESDLQDDIPEKYRGKSVQDIIKMHQNAESELGRKGNELGQYMSLTDQLLQLKRSDDLRKGGASEEDIDDEPSINITTDELLDNPTAALTKIVDARLGSQNRKKEKTEAEKAYLEQARDFASRHPNAKAIAESEEFRAWVEQSPIRQIGAANAGNGDIFAADALLTEWKALQEQSKDDEPQPDPAADNIKAARRASTEKRGSSTASDAPTGKTYKRLDLIRLKLSDPEAYADPEFQREIMLAYAQGRVK